MPVFRSENEVGISVPSTRDYGYDPSPKDYVLFVESSMPDLKGVARVELGFFINSEVHVIELRGSKSRLPDPRNNSSLSLVPQEGFKSIPTTKAYGVKLLPSSRASVKGNEPRSPDPVDGGSAADSEGICRLRWRRGDRNRSRRLGLLGSYLDLQIQ